jgi:site-specific DNA-methyltransferase (adenine-specific)
MKIEYIGIDKIKPYHNNPRKNDNAIEPVSKSIQQFGWQQPIVVDGEMVIIVGHTRYEAAKKLGLDKVPVVIATGLSKEQARSYRLVDNKTGDLSRWDTNKLLQELDALIGFDLSAYDLSIPDFEVKESTAETEKSDIKYKYTCSHCGHKF